MKRLLTIDDHNYTDDMPLIQRRNVRAVIRRGKELALEQSRLGDYKIPGGGVDPGESLTDALIREVREETGLIVLPDTIRPIGEIVEIREDLFQQGQKYICYSYYYACDVAEEMTDTAMTESELRMGFHLSWAEPETAIEANRTHRRLRWPARDTAFLKLLAEGTVSL